MTAIASTAAPPMAATDVRPLSDHEFLLFQRLIYRQAGIFLSDSKKELLVARLRRRLRELEIRSFLTYYRLLEHDPDERMRMLDYVSTHETQFFREPRQLEFLERRILPGLRTAAGGRPRGLRAWSAGCSTGEEPYSLAMILLSNLPGWRIEILATDLSGRTLEQARAAVWPIEKAEAIPIAYRKQFMLRGRNLQAGKMKPGPEVRSVVRFKGLNLNDQAYPALGLFDLILCRNVLIYFDAESKERVVRSLLAHLAPHGALFLGHAESLNGVNGQVRRIGPNAYAHAAQRYLPITPPEPARGGTGGRRR